MEDLGWLRNMWLPWSNMNHHHNQQEIEDSFMFCSENIFSNPIQDLRKTNSNILLNPITTSGRITPATTDSSSFGAANQHWSQTTGFNSFHDDENVIPTTTTAAAATVKSVESLDCLLSGTNSNANSSSDHDDGFSIIFPDYKNLCNNIINNLTGVSDDSVTKDIDDGIASKSSSAKRLNHNSMIHEHYQPRSKKSRSDPGRSTSSTINFRQETSESDETDSEEITQMKEMIYRTAAFRPVIFSDEEAVEKPRRKNVRISSDPQTVAARQRREKISERIRVLQKLVPGGNKMDTASMLDEAANYLKFLRSQVKALEQCGQKFDYRSGGTTTNAQSANQIVQNFGSSNVTLGIPFPMQTHFLLPQQLYPAPPPA